MQSNCDQDPRTQSIATGKEKIKKLFLLNEHIYAFNNLKMKN